MADEPENLVLQLLREIRGKLDEQGAKIDQLIQDGKEQKRRSIYALGTASGAEFQANNAEQAADRAIKRIDDLISALKKQDIHVDA